MSEVYERLSIHTRHIARVTRLAVIVTMLGSAFCLHATGKHIAGYRASTAVHNTDETQGRPIVEDSSDLFQACLLLARDYFPDIDVAQSCARFDAIVEVLRDHIADRADPIRTVTTINQYLFEELGIQPVGVASVSTILPHRVLEEKKGHCLGLSLIYAAIAERLDLPIHATSLPAHVRVTYADGQWHFDIETMDRGAIRHIMDGDLLTANISALQPCDRRARRLTKSEFLGVFLTDIGAVLSKEGRNDDALDAYERAMRLFPESAELHANLGRIHLGQTRVGEAHESFRTAVRLDPDLWQARSGLAHVHYAQGRYDEAVAEYLRAIERLNASIVIPAFLENVPDTDPADWIRQVLIAPDAPAPHLVGGGVLSFRVQDYETAYLLFERALSNDPSDPLLAWWLANTCIRMGRYAEARSLSAKVEAGLGYVPTYGPAYIIGQLSSLHVELGKAYGMQGRYESSIDAIRKAIEIGGLDDANAIVAMGDTCALMGKTEAAIKYYSWVLAVDPSHSWACAQRQRLQARMIRNQCRMIGFAGAIAIITLIGISLAIKWQRRQARRSEQV